VLLDIGRGCAGRSVSDLSRKFKLAPIDRKIGSSTTISMR